MGKNGFILGQKNILVLFFPYNMCRMHILKKKIPGFKKNFLTKINSYFSFHVSPHTSRYTWANKMVGLNN